MNWHYEDVMRIVEQLQTDLTVGLTDKKIAEKINIFGENKLTVKPKKTLKQRYFEQLKDIMVIILIIAAIISLIVAIISKDSNGFFEPIIILAIVFLNATLGVFQESKAENALEALQNMSSPNSKVIRNDKVTIIPSSKVVPGDIIKLETGDYIPADCRIFESASLKVDESPLTGESVPVEKSVNAKVSANAPLGERTNMLYSGCSVSNGRCSAIVTSTGMDTEIGRIAKLLDNEENSMTPLQEKLAHMGKQMGFIALIICFIIFIIGVIDKIPVIDIFITSISLAVAAIPEGLPAIVTIVLALGVQRMVTKNAIVRKLPAVETLGSASVICSDKTGTLTQNKMTVTHIWTKNEVEHLENTLQNSSVALLNMAILCCDGDVDCVNGEVKHIGDPTETAIVFAGKNIGIDKKEINMDFPRCEEIPFDSDRKLMTTIHKSNGKYLVIVKGAFDILSLKCNSGNIDNAKQVNEEMSKMALRVIAVAYKEVDTLPSLLLPQIIENDLMLLGLIGMIDPPREEAKNAVALCRKAGIRPIMITGDHVITASAIAEKLGILVENTKAISGLDLAKLSDIELVNKISDYSVYARVTPEDKIRIIKAWQLNGNIVAMTGDGVNDAPALKAADIGCAMGSGTDVAKGAADIILTDDNFSTIVKSVEEGRCIYDNIKKAVKFLLSCNIGEIFSVLVTMLIWGETPLLAMQLLWINLVTDGLPALALGMEPAEKDIMERKPNPKDEGIFTGNMISSILLNGSIFAIITIFSYYLGKTIIGTIEAGRTMAFLVLSFSQLFHAFNSRSERSIFKIGVLKNKYMLGAFSISSLLIMLIVIIPPVSRIFGLVDLTFNLYIAALILSFLPILIVEIEKFIRQLFKKK
ncbi:MAG: calcium-translocating P-type ATPase, PMCA-type [Oscillospiraceae bacterium]